MAYTVNKTDGTVVTTIVDSTIDNTTSITLFGKSYSGFGELLNEDLVKLLENSASTSAPTAPLKGELWFDTVSNSLKVYDGTSFKPSGGARTSATEPSSPSAGDLWHDSDDDQVYVYSGSAWILVGPSYTAGQGESGFKIETINDDGGVARVISSLYNGAVRVAILSNVTFTPQVSISGFATITAGLSLNSTLGASFTGSTTSASAVDISGTTNTSATVIAGGNMMRKDADQTLDGRLTAESSITVVSDVSSPSGGLELSLSGINNTIANKSQGGFLNLGVKHSSGDKTPITLDGTNNRVGIYTTSPTTDLDITGNVKITGNLSITGEYEQLSSQINLVENAFIKLNSGNTEANAGIIVETTDTDDARLFYRVSDNNWVAGENGTYSQLITLTDAVTDGHANNERVLKTTSAGLVKVTTLQLGAVGSNIATTDTSNLSVPTTGQIAESIGRWGGSVTSGGGADSDASNNIAGKRYIGLVAPSAGVNDAGTSDGDIWFVREA